MCLAAVYMQEDDSSRKQLVLDKVQLIQVDGTALTCTNLFGEVANVHGSIKVVDLANSTVTLALLP